jgi:SAM-dependent methyltransferase
MQGHRGRSSNRICFAHASSSVRARRAGTSAFPDDEPAYADAIAALRLQRGDIVVDLGCGTGRALPLLQRAVGDDGLVVGVDATPEMLRAVSDQKRNTHARLVLADATRLPVAPNRVDAVFAAGLLTHVPDPGELLGSLSRTARPDCRLAIFHPIGREALARRHHRRLRPDELLDPRVLPQVLAAAGWTVDDIDDADHRYLALASRSP